MIIAIASAGVNLSSEVAERFGRAEYFIIYNTETKEFKAIKNTSKDDVSGAGQKAIKTLYNNNVKEAIVPEFGPKAKVAAKEFEIKGYLYGEYKTVEAAIKAYESGLLEEEKLDDKPGLRMV